MPLIFGDSHVGNANTVESSSSRRAKLPRKNSISLLPRGITTNQTPTSIDQCERVCVQIYIYIYTYTRILICIHIDIDIDLDIGIDIKIDADIDIDIDVDTCMYMYIYICIYTEYGIAVSLRVQFSWEVPPRSGSEGAAAGRRRDRRAAWDAASRAAPAVVKTPLDGIT